jgi:hypothetical protein
LADLIDRSGTSINHFSIQAEPHVINDTQDFFKDCNQNLLRRMDANHAAAFTAATQTAIYGVTNGINPESLKLTDLTSEFLESVMVELLSDFKSIQTDFSGALAERDGALAERDLIYSSTIWKICTPYRKLTVFSEIE